MTAGREPISETKDWCTPPEYVDAVRRVFATGIGLDPCSNAHSIVGADVEIFPPADGLAVLWDASTVYVNPPYGLALVPVATNTRHWRDHVFTATGICFLKVPRLKFTLGGLIRGKGAPMACAVVYWGGDFDHFQDVFRELGVVLSCPR